METPRIEADRISDMFDVLYLNRYFRRYSQTRELSKGTIGLGNGLRQTHRDDRLRGYTLAALHSVHALPAARSFRLNCSIFTIGYLTVESVLGEHVWNIADFQTAIGINWVDWNEKESS